MFFTDFVLQTSRKNDRMLVPELVQYCNETIVTRQAQDCVAVGYQILQPNKTYLNIGTGAGLLEHFCRNRNVQMDTVEYVDEEDLDYQPYFERLRKHYKVDITYQSTNYYDGYEIKDCTRKYDEAIIIRFGPWQKRLEDSDPRLVDTLITNLFQIVDVITILKGSLSRCHVRYLQERETLLCKDDLLLQLKRP